MADVLKTLRALGCFVMPCGSRVTCKPAPTDTDADYLVEPWPTTAVQDVLEFLCDAGFELEGNTHNYQPNSSQFASWRSGEINLIVTSDSGFARKFRAATYVAKRLNVMKKTDRIALFEAVLYSRFTDDDDYDVGEL